MSEDVENVVAQCNTCLKFRRNSQKEPLMSHPIPEHPWQTVVADIMTFKSHDYLVVVGYFSKYPEIALLESKTAATIILHMKSIYDRCGIPEILVCSNIPFASREFQQFTESCGILLQVRSFHSPMDKVSKPYKP